MRNRVQDRIVILDGFRAISILMVLFSHYFSKWKNNDPQFALYPYKDSWNYFHWAGRSGVNFFFIISGFVIFFTLERTATLTSFWKKRLIRLVPSALVAAIFILLFFTVFDKAEQFPESHRLINILPSITFVTPSLLNQLFSVKTAYLDGSLWSLWPEIQFYFLASIIYFISRKHFLRNFLLVSALLIAVNFLISNILGANHLHLQWNVTGAAVVLGIFDLPVHLPFFATGVLFYQLYSNQQHSNLDKRVYTGLLLLLLFILYSSQQWYYVLPHLAMFIFFLGFILKPELLRPLENKTICSIGKSSYFTYLVHQQVGVFIIANVGIYFGVLSPLFSIVLMVVLILFSEIYTQYAEEPLRNALKRKLVR